MNLSKRSTIIASAALGLGLVAAATGVTIALTNEPAEAAEPQRMLDDATHMGVVELAVDDRDLMTGYYTEAVGLEVVSEEEGTTLLGLGDVDLIRLVDADLSPRTAGSAGLYHSAILFADEASLADTILLAANVAPATFTGAADHSVSQAFYFTDPEGNGLELYVDRPRDQWEWNDGIVTMGSYFLDPNQFITTYATGSPEGRTAVMGHVHLSVGETGEAEDFYSGLIGFDVTSRSEGAVFMSAGGYHHHLAANMWNSAGAGVRGDEFGLSRFEIVAGSAADLDGIESRLGEAGWEYERDGDTITVDDPWGNTAVITASE